jgi:uncharacterized phage protein (TIGR02218 family)
MPRAIDLDLLPLLDGPVLTLANYVRLELLSGTVLGFTSFDRDLTFGGVTYEAFSSVGASSVRQSEGSGVDNLDIVGLITSDSITEVDLLAGLYDGATVELGQINYENLGMDPIIHLTGTLGEITEREGEYTAEIRGLAQHLGQQIGQLTAPLCRVRAFGDSECIPPGDPLTTLVLAAHQNVRTVSVVTSATQITFAAESNISNYYRYGRVEFQTGLNAGFEREVKSHTLSAGTGVIVLQEAFPFQAQVGDTALLEAGCDRTLGRCTFFGNTINGAFEPYLPGNWMVLRRGRR